MATSHQKTNLQSVILKFLFFVSNFVIGINCLRKEVIVLDNEL